MPRTVKVTKEETSIEIQEIHMETATYCVLGRTPLIMNRLAEKARQELLFPSPKMNRAEREQRIKHDPIGEFRSSVYRYPHDKEPTRLLLPSNAFKKALAAAALDMPGATKAQMGRLTSVQGINVSVYGVPKVFTSVVRQGMNKTPDIRTRAILPEWACIVAVEYAIIKPKQISNLFGAAGMIIGVGDFRPEKGAGAYGKFELVGLDNKDFKRITSNQGRVAQDKALANPEYYDVETEELLTWFDAEVIKRETRVPSTKGNGKRAAA